MRTALALAAVLCVGATQAPQPRLAPERPATASEAAAPAPEAIAAPNPPRLAPERPGLTDPPWMELTGDALPELTACRRRLARTGARLLDRRRDSSVCGMAGGVEISRLGAASLRPVKIDCAFAEVLDQWRAAANIAAQTHFKADIARILHFGGYACRPVGRRGFISAHSMGAALDVSGVVLTDGSQITVLKHWGADGPESALLSDMFAAACELFTVSLSPEYDAAHRDHFHFDVSDLRECL